MPSSSGKAGKRGTTSFSQMKRHRIIAALAALSLTAGMAVAQVNPAEFDRAMELYRKGMYGEARALFETMKGNDALTKGYALLCSERLQADYTAEREAYLANWPFSGLLPELQYRHGLNLFDKGDYEGLLRAFRDVTDSDVPAKEKAGFLFKRGYSRFMTEDLDLALQDFSAVDKMPSNNFTAPSRYMSGYIRYECSDFKEALGWFEQSVKDPRFAEMSGFYIMECRFMLKDYAYVTRHAEEMYAQVPAERRPRLGRIISEAYLIQGDAGRAKRYYDGSRDGNGRDRGDYFYAGTLAYATGDYAGAIDNYSKMDNRTDSLGQIANYQLGYSYIQTKNKVSAAESFEAAAQAAFDPQIREDAFFNYAKLSFDLNNDPAPFEAYIRNYPEVDRGEQIYGYMALAALHNRDYAAAVEAYDNIEELDADQQRNYMKANYLRAKQLVDNGSWRATVPYLKAAAYYSDRRSGFNQLSRYWLAEAYYRDADYVQSRSLYNDLYNISALDGRTEGTLLPYNIAYTYFQEGNYAQAAKWFGDYVADGGVQNRRDAMVRLADCSFLQKKYAEAVTGYENAVRAFDDLDDLYPVCQAGICYGLVGQPAKKISTLSRAEKASPDAFFYGEALYELGRAYVDAAQPAKAASVFRDLVGKCRDNGMVARGLIELGMISRNDSRYDEALDYFKQVVEQMPESGYAEDALLAIESIYQVKQEPEVYLAYVESLENGPVRTDAERSRILFNGAEQIFLAGNFQKALASLLSYEEKYPSGENVPAADFYIAECYARLGMKEQACDYYRKLLSRGQGTFLEAAALQYATLSYGMERYDDAVEGYQYLQRMARSSEGRHTAGLGLMLSSYAGKKYEDAVRYADLVAADAASTDAEKRQADYVKAKSFLSMSRRAEAFALLDRLAQQPSTDEGAEAAYLRIQDSYDKGDFSAVESRVFDFSGKAGRQAYWLAKSFILLGDSYVELENYRQARATFESVRDGYSGKDEVHGEVVMRLDKLSEMNK